MIKKLVLFLMLLLSFSISAFSQFDATETYLSHKKTLDNLFKQKPSLKRDTLIILQMDSLTKAHRLIPNFDTLGNNSLKYQYHFYRQFTLKTKWQKGVALNLSNTGRNKLEAGNAVVGLKELLAAEKIFEKIGDKQNQIINLISISVAFTYYTDSLSALPFIDKALKIARAINDTDLIRHCLNYKGDYFVVRNLYEKAFHSYFEISKLKKLDKNKSVNYWTNNLYLGLWYLYRNEENKALNLIKNAFSQMPYNTQYYQYLHITIRSGMIKYYLAKKQFSKAKRVADEVDKLMVSKKLDVDKRYYNPLEFNTFKYQYYKGLGNYKEAMINLEEVKGYHDLFGEANLKNRMEGIKAQLALKDQTEKLNKTELEKLKNERDRQNQLKYFFIALALIGSFSTFYIFRINKILKYKNENPKGKNKEISAALLKVQTTERQRVAIDLHDNLGSTISSIKYSLEAIDRTKMNAEEVAVQENLYSLLDKAYNDVRLLSHNLLPEEFEKKGLTETLTEFIRKINKASKIKFNLNIDENLGRQDHKIEFELYSICMELVTNIMKHSKATEARITLNKKTRLPRIGELCLTVSDNGIGIFKNDSDGIGMKNIQARVDSINGKWSVKSIEGEGVVNEILV